MLIQICPFVEWGIQQTDRFGSFEYQTCLVFRWLLYLVSTKDPNLPSTLTTWKPDTQIHPKSTFSVWFSNGYLCPHDEAENLNTGLEFKLYLRLEIQKQEFLVQSLNGPFGIRPTFSIRIPDSSVFGWWLYLNVHYNFCFAGNVPTNELQIYTWMDATLRELTTLVRKYS